MRLQRLTKYLLSHRWQAFVLTLLITSTFGLPGGSVISSIGMVFACLVTLVKGPKEGALFTLAATLPYIAFAVAQGGFTNLLPTTMVGVFVLGNILSWIFAILLYRKATWTQIIQIEALVGVFAVSVIHLVFPGVVDWWAQQILASLQVFKQIVIQNSWENYVNLPTDMPLLAAQSAQTATGFTIDFILVVSILQLVVARWWQDRTFELGIVSKELCNIRVGQLAGLFFVSSFVLLYYGNAVIMDIMPVMVLLFAIAGLSLMHYFFSLMPRTPSKWFWILLTYTVILYSLQISVLLLSIFALFDVWLDLRKRFIKVS